MNWKVVGGKVLNASVGLRPSSTTVFKMCLYEYFQSVLVLPFYRSEIKMWSPLASEGGKTNPYKMNLESEPQVHVELFVCTFLDSSVLS